MTWSKIWISRLPFCSQKGFTTHVSPNIHRKKTKYLLYCKNLMKGYKITSNEGFRFFTHPVFDGNISGFSSATYCRLVPTLIHALNNRLICPTLQAPYKHGSSQGRQSMWCRFLEDCNRVPNCKYLQYYEDFPKLQKTNNVPISMKTRMC